MPGYTETISKLINNRKLNRICELGVFDSKGAERVFVRCESQIKLWIGIDPYIVIEGLDYVDHTFLMDQDRYNKHYAKATERMSRFYQHSIIRMMSYDAVKLFQDRYFDMVILDGDHSREGTKRDIKDWLPKVRSGGVFCGHDYGNNHYPGVKEAVQECFGDNFKELDATIWQVDA